MCTGLLLSVRSVGVVTLQNVVGNVTTRAYQKREKRDREREKREKKKEKKSERGDMGACATCVFTRLTPRCVGFRMPEGAIGSRVNTL